MGILFLAFLGMIASFTPLTSALTVSRAPFTFALLPRAEPIAVAMWLPSTL